MDLHINFAREHKYVEAALETALFLPDSTAATVEASRADHSHIAHSVT